MQGKLEERERNSAEVCICMEVSSQRKKPNVFISRWIVHGVDSPAQLTRKVKGLCADSRINIIRCVFMK